MPGGLDGGAGAGRVRLDPRRRIVKEKRNRCLYNGCKEEASKAMALDLYLKNCHRFNVNAIKKVRRILCWTG